VHTKSGREQKLFQWKEEMADYRPSSASTTISYLRSNERHLMTKSLVNSPHNWFIWLADLLIDMCSKVFFPSLHFIKLQFLNFFKKGLYVKGRKLVDGPTFGHVPDDVKGKLT
jgi:hypothetical protein